MSRIGKQIFFYVFLPLLTGYFIYFFFRPEYWFVKIIEKREAVLNINELSLIEKILIFSGSDFCWAFSFSSALFLWEANQQKRFRFLPVIVLIILVGSELIQPILTAKFTLDWWDVFAALLAFCLSFVLLRRRYEKK